jgi:hypothetical protein
MLMNKLAGWLLFSGSFLIASWVFAQNAEQPSLDPGVLVSPPIQDQGALQDQGAVQDNAVQHKHQQADINSSASAQIIRDSSDSASPSNPSPTQGPSPAVDDVIAKEVKNIIFEMTINLKLTQDQISAVTPVITDNMVKVRKLQQSLEKGDIDSSTMNSDKEQLTKDEIQALAAILTPEQMQIWLNTQNHSARKNK